MVASLATEKRTTDNAVEREAQAWMSDPIGHFGGSVTRAHSVPRDEVNAVQLAAINLRLAQRRQQISTLAKLADAQGIHDIARIEDAVPLLFEHNVYKSYPISLLAKQRFDQLTTWLSRLTTCDLSGVDVSSARSIDEWLEKLRDDTPLDVATSSGTSGTMSFFPKTKNDYRQTVRTIRMQLLQTFGIAPTEDDISGKLHSVIPGFRDGYTSAGRFPHYYREVFGLGDDAYVHTAYPATVSADLMWLAGRLRSAAAKGDVTRVEVPENLLARRAELENMQRDLAGQQASFIRRISEELRGQRVSAMGLWPMFYDVAKAGLESGVRDVFTPDSNLTLGGGAKGMTIPDDMEEVVREFFGVSRLKMSYGMTEINSYSFTCEHDRYHVLPWLILFVLDPETGQSLPRSGVQTGRAAYFDMTNDGTWGGLITGDKVTVDWDSYCPCGRSTVTLHNNVQRFSELQGGDDKITCAATQSAQAEAMDYLTSLDI